MRYICNMDFRTKIEITRQEPQINHMTKMMLFGSCFSENIGGKLKDYKFDVDVNPFGILYNPLSILSNIERLIEKRNFEDDDIVEHNGIYQSFMHHGDFSDVNKSLCLSKIRTSFDKACEAVMKTDVFLFTFGTAYIFRLKETNEVVANCHKFPAATFERERLTVEQIVDKWSGLIDKLLENNPNVRMIFTVSPIRHWKDGAHENNVSKAILHLAIDNLKLKYPKSVIYFPAYEIVMDELRDYRFYANDMMHPSAVAVEYIWERFGDAFLSEQTIGIGNEWRRIRQAMEHRPINPNSESHRAFLKQTLSKLIEYDNKYPFINLTDEIKNLTERIEK